MGKIGLDLAQENAISFTVLFFSDYSEKGTLIWA